MPDIKPTPQTANQRQHGLLQSARLLPPITMAVAHPCDADSLLGALDAAQEGLVKLLLVGPRKKIQRVAEDCGADISAWPLIDVPHSHAAAAEAVRLVRAGEAQALMKGSLHTDELMAEVTAQDTGLRTGRRMSHVFIMDVPTYPKHLLITDAAINIEPTLADKRDIVQNAINLAHILGVSRPHVAIVSSVETVNPAIRSTVDAAALCKMADRGQITGGVLDGPLGFDNAISLEAAERKGIKSPVSGRADILVVPDLDAGNMLAKQLQYLAGALAAGIVLGAKVPIVLTSRADDRATRVASCAAASLVAHHQHGEKA